MLGKPPALSIDASTRSSPDLPPVIGEHTRHRTGHVLIERFELLRLLGSGSYGDVYEAVDRQNPAPPVAVKILRHSSPHALYRFKQEFRQLAQLTHPNIVILHELFLERDDAFFSMELVHGRDLISFVRPHGQLHEERLWDVTRQLSHALAALHAAGKLHRDLKPSNVLVEESGRVVIVDFGLAIALEQASERGEQSFVGTPRYAAPEQLGLGEVGPESDWYALGTMLYEAIAGRPPYEQPLHQLTTAKKSGCATELCVPLSLQPLATLSMQLLEPTPGKRAGYREACEQLSTLSSLPSPLPVGHELPFVGRDHELTALRACFERVEAGHAAIALVTGQSGLGKTAVIEELLSGLQREGRALVLRGRCYVNEDVPYRAFDGVIDQLSQYLQGLTQPEAASLLPSSGVHELVRLFPVLRRTAPHSLLETVHNEIAVRDRAVAALGELLANISDRLPLVLFVDDLQWDDEDSAWLFARLLSVADPPSLMFVAACRDSERAQSCIARLLTGDSLQRHITHEIALGALCQAEVRQLAARAAGTQQISDAVLDSLAQESAGHPMFAIELARSATGARGERALQFSLDATIARRAEELSTGARALLMLACVAGHRLKISTALASSDTHQGNLRELLRERLLTRSSGHEDELEVYHDRIREAVLATEPRDHVVEVHRTLATALSDEAAPRYDLVVEHYLAASLEAQAARFARRAAEQANHVLALHRVPPLIELALAHSDVSEKATLYEQLGQAYALIGRNSLAARAYVASAELSQDAAQKWELGRMAMWQSLQAGELPQGLTLFAQLHRGLGRPPPQPSMLWCILVAIIWSVWWLIVGPPKLQSANHHVHDSREHRQLKLIWSAATGLLDADPIRATYLSMRAFQLAARLGETTVYASMLATSSVAPTLWAGRRHRASEQNLQRAEQLAQASGDAAAQQMVALSQATYFLFSSQFSKAADRLRDLLGVAADLNPVSTYVRQVTSRVAGPVFFWSGQVSSTRKHATELVLEARQLGEHKAEQTLRALNAYRFLCDGEAERAVHEWTSATEGYENGGALRDAIWGVVVGLYGDRLDVVQRALDFAKRDLLRWNLYASRTLYTWTVGAVAAACLERGQNTLKNRLTLSAASLVLRFERTAVASPMRHHLLAASAFSRSYVQVGTAHLSQSRRGFHELGIGLFAACASHALAALVDDQEAREMYLSEAREVFEREGIREPARWVRALLPGIPISE